MIEEIKVTEIKKPELIINQLITIKEIFNNDIDNIKDEVDKFLKNHDLHKLQYAITAGDGDSYYASLATELAFHCFTDIKYFPFTALKFICYGIDKIYDFRKSPTLAIGISASGTSARVIEAMNFTKEVSETIVSLGIIGNLESPLNNVCDSVISTELPDLGRSPGIRTYLGSLFGLYLLAIQIGVVKKIISQNQSRYFTNQIRLLGNDIDDILAVSNEQINSAVDICKEKPMMSFVGCGPSLGTAMFSAAKIVEATGKFIAVQDLEEWGHIERFSYPLDYPVFMIAPPGSSYQRAIKLAKAVTLLGHPLIAVVNKHDEEISKYASVTFRMPDISHELFTPLTYFLPGTLLAYHLAKELGRCLLQTDNDFVNSIRNELNHQTKIVSTG